VVYKEKGNGPCGRGNPSETEKESADTSEAGNIEATAQTA
jgi:hypothetical protein